jgi:hypothetical protein
MACQPESLARGGVVRLRGASRRLRRTSFARTRAKDGEPRRNRTFNPQIKSLLLCQLS